MSGSSILVTLNALRAGALDRAAGKIAVPETSALRPIGETQI
jgi:hypothetical protein